MSEQHAYPLTTAQTSYALLTEIERLAIEEPARINMGVVCYRGQSLLDKIKHNLKSQEPKRFRLSIQAIIKSSSCNTVGCIAGWTLVRTGYAKQDVANSGSTEFAAVILGLSSSQERELFYPDLLIDATNKQTRAHARAVVTHIRAFKAKYKDQLMAHKIVVNREGEV